MPFSNQVVNKNIDDERCFYRTVETSFINVTLDGPNHGEYGFLECYNIEVINSNFKLKYLFRYNNYLQVKTSNFNYDAIDAIWYCSNVNIQASNLNSPRLLRNCQNVIVDSCSVKSDDFAYQLINLQCRNSEILGFCTFLELIYSYIDNSKIFGKQALKNAKQVTITNSYIESDDCLYCAQNLILRNCTIKGEKIAWYSANITFDNCKIIGSKPICFSRNVRFISCEFVDSDNCFEQSEVYGYIFGNIINIKDPYCGSLVSENVPEIIYSDETKKNNAFSIRRYKNY